MRAILVDDDEKRPQIKDIRSLFRRLHVELAPDCEFLGKIGVETFKEGINALHHPPDIAVIDYKLGWKDIENREWEGDKVAAYLRERWPDENINIIYVSSRLRGAPDPFDILVRLVQQPLSTYVEFNPDWIPLFEHKVLAAYDAVGYRPPAYLSPDQRPVAEQFRDAAQKRGVAIIGESARTLDMLLSAYRASTQNFPIMLFGDRGVGKHTLARAIHAAGSGRKSDFEFVECSELAGEPDLDPVLNALTEQGAVFLNNVELLPTTQQAKLSKALRRAITEKSLNAVLISASTVFEEDIVKNGFSEALLRMINGFPIKLPSLADRAPDIAAIAAHILDELGGKAGRKWTLAAKARDQIVSQDWPGNIEEMARALRVATINAADNRTIQLAHLPPPPERVLYASSGVTPAQQARRAELKAMRELVERCGGNKTQAAKLAGMSREGFLRKYNKYLREEEEENASPPDDAP